MVHEQTNRPVLKAALAGLGLLLAGLILSRGLAAYLAASSPSTALLLDPGNPEALVQRAYDLFDPRNRMQDPATAAEEERARLGERIGGLSELALKAATAELPAGEEKNSAAPPMPELPPKALTEEERRQIRADLVRALARDPYNSRALRLLGQLTELESGKAAAIPLMRAAADRSLGQTSVVFWLLVNSYEQGDIAGTLRYLDAFLRKRPRRVQQAMPVIIRMAESPDPAVTAQLVGLLATMPPWRFRILHHLVRDAKDPGTTLNLLLALKDTAGPPSFGELRAFLLYLTRTKRYDLAYYTRLQFLTPEELANVGFIVNGNFETKPSGLPFDWTINPGSGVTIDIGPRPDQPENNALSLFFGPGRAEFSGVVQEMLLPPGNYQVKGVYKGEINGRRGTQWWVRCLASRLPNLGEGPMLLGPAPKWSEFSFTFTVPPANCPAQELRLVLAARSASEQIVTGNAWYDDIQVERAPEPEPEPAAGEPAAQPQN